MNTRWVSSDTKFTRQGFVKALVDIARVAKPGKFWLILHTPGPEIRLHVAYIYIDTPCAIPPYYPSIRYA